MNKIDRLKWYDDLYYNDGTSPITDEEYDVIKDQARIEFPNDTYFNDVGAPILFKNREVKLPYVLGSLKKVKPDTLFKWLKDKDDITISDKVDGVSVMVHYNNGKVVFAATRGSGIVGKEITDKAKIFCPHINVLDDIILRGDAILKGDTYVEMGYKTRRNGTAGVLNADGIKGCENIDVYFYELIKSPVKLSNELDRLVYISLLGNNVRVSQFSHLDLTNPIEHLMEVLRFGKRDYIVDGIVLTDNFSERENVFYPENKVAFKVQGDPMKTKVIDIEWNVGRTGRIIPTIIVEPITIGGVTISRATGFNAKFVLDNHIGKESVVSLVRSGDVVPYIVSVDDSDTTDIGCYSCPSCDGEIEWKGVDLVCNSTECKISAFKRVSYFLRKLGVENITEKTLEKLEVDTIQKAYELDEFEIANISGFGIKRGEQIVNEIKKTLKTTPEKLLAAFGIAGIGIEISTSIFNNMSIDDIFDLPEGYFSSNIDGIGDKLDSNLIYGLPYFKIVYDYLLLKGLKFVENGEDIMKGMLFALTGTMILKRDAIIKMIESKGGSVKGITKNTNYLVSADPTSGSSKLEKANKYGIKIISFEELMEMLGE
uniref:DNA ligase (NAD(+)) n=1 Tax=viral metagenome TaxID=1070528 RepID=A0A6M3IMD3_9ZZZZ